MSKQIPNYCYDFNIYKHTYQYCIALLSIQNFALYDNEDTYAKQREKKRQTQFLILQGLMVIGHVLAVQKSGTNLATFK